MVKKQFRLVHQTRAKNVVLKLLDIILPGDAPLVVAAVLVLVLGIVPAGSRSCFRCRLPAKT